MNYLATSDRFAWDVPGGGYGIAWELAKLQQRRGHRVSMLCGAYTGSTKGNVQDCDGIRVVRYKVPTTFKLDPRRLSLNLAAAREASRRYLSDVNWDVVHAHMTVSGLAAFELFGASAYRVCTIHSPAVLEQQINWSDGTWSGALKCLLGTRLLARAEARLYEQASTIHVLSSYTEREVASLFGPNVAHKFQRIPWWSNPAKVSTIHKQEARTRLGIAQDRYVLLAVRRMVRRNGLDVLLEALSCASLPPAVEVFIIGDGPERQKYMASVQGKPHLPATHFLGNVDDDTLATYYRAADLSVVPSVALECFGIIVIESLANGCPVLVSDVGALPELVRPIMPRCIFRHSSPVELAALLEQAANGQVVFPSASELQGFVEDRYSKRRLEEQYQLLLTPKVTSVVAA